MLAGLILLAACANLGLCLPRAPPTAAGSCASAGARLEPEPHSAPGLYRSLLISLVGGALGLAGSVVLLRDLSAWQPFASYFRCIVTVNADATVYAMALCSWRWPAASCSEPSRCGRFCGRMRIRW